METIVTSGGTRIVKTISKVWEAMKIKVKTAVNSLAATTMECLLISPLNYIRNINFFLFSFFCHIDICSGHYRNFKISLCQISNLSFYLNEYRLRKIFFLSLYSFFFFFAYLSHVRTKFWHKYVITDGAFMIIA